MIPAAAAPGIERLIFSQKRSGIQYCNILELSKLLEITTFRIPEAETKRLFILHTKLLTPEIIHDFLGKQGGRRGCHLPADKNFSDSYATNPKHLHQKRLNRDLQSWVTDLR